jgi:hypothetical protein
VASLPGHRSKVGECAPASIAGTVKDASGAILPGVLAEASSAVLIEMVRSATTDGTGQYKIIDLRPGTYSVTFTLTGFSALKRDGSPSWLALLNVIDARLFKFGGPLDF